jgi:hypothetical protein
VLTDVKTFKMAIIAFQFFIKHMLKSHQEQFCMWKECIFQTVKIKQKNLETKFGDWNLNE